jgi:hypothetical protein
LSSENVVDIAARALRADGDGQPNLKSASEAVALVGHACMVAVDFRLVGLGEDHSIGLSMVLRALLSVVGCCVSN